MSQAKQIISEAQMLFCLVGAASLSHISWVLPHPLHALFCRFWRCSVSFVGTGGVLGALWALAMLCELCEFWQCFARFVRAETVFRGLGGLCERLEACVCGNLLEQCTLLKLLWLCGELLLLAPVNCGGWVSPFCTALHWLYGALVVHACCCAAWAPHCGMPVALCVVGGALQPACY